MIIIVFTMTSPSYFVHNKQIDACNYYPSSHTYSSAPLAPLTSPPSAQNYTTSHIYTPLSGTGTHVTPHPSPYLIPASSPPTSTLTPHVPPPYVPQPPPTYAAHPPPTYAAHPPPTYAPQPPSTYPAHPPPTSTHPSSAPYPSTSPLIPYPPNPQTPSNHSTPAYPPTPSNPSSYPTTSSSLVVPSSSSGSGSTSTSHQSKPLSQCALPGCTHARKVSQDNRLHDYCCQEHAVEGIKFQQVPQATYVQHASTRSKLPFFKAKHKPYFSSRAKVINFYNQHEPYYEFTNFYPAEVQIGGQRWPTTEHYFQAMKFQGSPLEHEVRRLHSPRDAFEFSRHHAAHVRRDWHSIKDQVMLQAVQAKFTQHPKLAKQLKKTGDALLVEHTKNDTYWGDGGDGSGANKLGLILMEVRKQLLSSY
jgi:ribA/ribD-fused uncharacterized protein